MHTQASPLPPIEELTMMRLPAVMAATGLKKSRIYQLERLGLFPKRRSLGDNSTGFLEFEVRIWLHDRVSNGTVKLTGALAPTTKPARAARKGARS